MERVKALVIGGGPAGLMAAEMLGQAGHPVVLTDAMPSVGRKFLMAGKSGLNLTKAESLERFCAAYGNAADWLAPSLAAFGPQDVQAWGEGLGQELFTGSTGRVFPVAMKASPLLRAWLERLQNLGLEIRSRWRWIGVDGMRFRFQTRDGLRELQPDVAVLALGGASWARLGSDGVWATLLPDVPMTKFAPANVGVSVVWSDYMSDFYGVPLKGIALKAGHLSSRGEILLSARGIEGGGIYPLSPALRQRAALKIDLVPKLDHSSVVARLSKPRGKASLSNHLRKNLGLSDVARALLAEVARPLPKDPSKLALLVKELQVPYKAVRPIDEAISTSGGVMRDGLDTHFMLKAHTGVFCAGEMLDWEAPTGGYLLTASFATGRAAGLGAARWLDQARPSARA